MNRKGFTLIEVMVCVMILFIMTIIGIQVIGGVIYWNSAKSDSNAVIIQQQDEDELYNNDESRY